VVARESCDRLTGIKAVAIDLDGVVYEGARLVPGADRAVERLRHLGKKVFFLTNNSGKSRLDLVDKLSRLNVKAGLEEVFTSGYGAGVFLRERRATGVLVLGSLGLKRELTDLGLRVSDDVRNPYLVIGLDQEFNYEKIAQGLRAALAGSVLVACNRDSNFTIEDGEFLPGCGAMVAAVEAAAGRSVDHVIGKPEPFLLEVISRRHKLVPGQIAVIGDVLEADIAMANSFGSPSIFIDRKRGGDKNGASIIPDFVAQSLEDAVQLFVVKEG
jgi:HAD superfamily hydrolase (TIGR01450 family)